jgi:hypothetical protein
MSYFEDASLVLIPSAQKLSKIYSVKPTDGTGDLTFTRSNDTATRVGPDGLIEKVRTNLITYSEDLSNAAYTNDPTDGSLTITANYGVAPDGTNTADRVQITRGASYSQIYQAKSVTAGIEYSFSLYLKSLSGTPTITILYNEGGAVGKVTLTSSWVRYTFTYNAPSTSTNYPMIALYAGDSASCDILAWGLQFETGVPTPYIGPTTSAAVSVGPVANVPRLDYLGSSCPRLLLEPQRTNKCPSSANYGNSFINTTATRNTTSAPTGYDEADLLQDNNVNGEHLLGQNFDSITNGLTYTVSCFFKANGSGGRAVIRYFVGSWTYAVYNLANGTVTLTDGVGTASIQNYGNGWYRCILTATASTDYAPFVTQIGVANSSNQFSYQGISSLGIYFWGYQAEAGAYATSLIPSYGAAVTRGADAVSLKDITSFGIGNSYTLFFELNLNSLDSNKVIYETRNSSGTTSFTIRNFTVGFRAYNNIDAAYPLPTVYGSNNKYVLRVDGTSYSVFYASSGTPTKESASITTARNFGYFTFDGGTTNWLLDQHLIFPTALSDAQCLELVS